MFFITYSTTRCFYVMILSVIQKRDVNSIQSFLTQIFQKEANFETRPQTQKLKKKNIIIPSCVRLSFAHSINLTWADVCKNWLVTFCFIEFIRSFDTNICNVCHVCWVRVCISIKKQKAQSFNNYGNKSW